MSAVTLEDQINLLLVDDEPRNLFALRSLLEPLGHNFVEASSGEDALRAVLETDFAVVLLDVRMPGLDGFETARLIKQRERSARTPIIFVTGAPSSEAQESYSLGISDFLTKPVDAEALIAKVSMFVDNFRMETLLRNQLSMVQEQTHLLEAEVDERSRLLERLGEEQRRYMTLVQGVSDLGEGMALGDANTFHFVNDAFCALTGLSRASLLVRPSAWTLLGRPVDPGYAGEIKEGEPAPGQYETFLERSDFERLPVEVSVQIVDTQDAPLYLVLVRDISKRKEVDALKGEVLSMVAHDLRSPITVIAGLTETLLKQWDRLEDDQRKQAVDIMRRNAARLSALVGDTLDVAGLEAKSLPLDLRDCDLATLLVDAIEELSAQGSHGFELEIDPNLAIVRGDQNRIWQVVSNLITNAMKFAPKDSLISISASQSEGFAEISVLDRGPGVPQPHLHRVFDKYFTAGAHASGAGLGLYISKKLVEAQGGTINVSSSPDEGTCFTFRLPAA